MKLKLLSKSLKQWLNFRPYEILYKRERDYNTLSSYSLALKIGIKAFKYYNLYEKITCVQYVQ